jgi:hypothetical protein
MNRQDAPIVKMLEIALTGLKTANRILGGNLDQMDKLDKKPCIDCGLHTEL